MLQLSNISKNYGSRQVLREVSLEVLPGELYGYVGGNGAGKTTSMRIMLGIGEADSGTVTLYGDPIDDRVRSKIGYMPEERGLYPKMTLIDQLTYFGVVHGIATRSARAAADYWLHRLGLSDRSGSPLESLSLGNQQRVQLAAALVHEPTALILDEPFSGLDPSAVETIADILREEAGRGIPVVFSSHQLELVEKLCDRIGILRDGRIIAQGTYEELGSAIGRQFVIETPVARDTWLSQLQASLGNKASLLSVSAERGNRTRLQVPDHFDEQTIVDVISRNGKLTAFYQWRPPLTEIYAAAMSGTMRSLTTATALRADQNSATEASSRYI